MTEPRTVRVYQLGLTAYDEVHQLQRGLQVQRREGRGHDTLLITEHRPVFTLGRSHPEPKLTVPRSMVESYGIGFAQTERGGDITYHGPGQLVAYGIVDLASWGCSVMDYVSGLEEAVIRVMSDWGLAGERKAAARGVWIAGRKIASVGIHVRRWVTMHGIALNVDPDMSHFELITPCGLPEVEMTSLSAELTRHVTLTDVVDAFVYHFGQVFECAVEPGQPAAKAAAS